MAVHEFQELLSWVQELNQNVHVLIKKNALEDSNFWFYDKEHGEITNKNHSFFQITGLRKIGNDEVVLEQPIILQDEIGYLGIICHRFDGAMHFLMQAKIEPGNVNKIQLSPTIQATKSNFTQKHGGKKPAYLDYFINASEHRIIVDQIQSEQSSRFFHKRNRNIIIEVEEDVEVLPSHKWMTLQQIKEFMLIDNLINMDTRTVLSCLPFYCMSEKDFQAFIPEMSCMDSALLASMKNQKDIGNNLAQIYQYINNYKMFEESNVQLVPLHELKNWKMENSEFVCQNPYSFKVVFCDIEIEGREVQKWTQPLFEATGIATFGLLTCVEDGIRKFLVRATPEVGSFDKIELGPTVQREYISHEPANEIDALFEAYVKEKKNVLFDVLLSEEGGRFYCEQNRNLIVEVNQKDIPVLPEGYFWVDYYTLNTLIQVNNNVNIQLRNLLSVLR